MHPIIFKCFLPPNLVHEDASSLAEKTKVVSGQLLPVLWEHFVKCICGMHTQTLQTNNPDRNRAETGVSFNKMSHLHVLNIAQIHDIVVGNVV